jgi:hypothetical protein
MSTPIDILAVLNQVISTVIQYLPAIVQVMIVALVIRMLVSAFAVKKELRRGE